MLDVAELRGGGRGRGGEGEREEGGRIEQFYAHPCNMTKKTKVNGIIPYYFRFYDVYF